MKNILFYLIDATTIAIGSEKNNNVNLASAGTNLIDNM